MNKMIIQLLKITQKIEITEEQIYQGNLLLVNSEYAVQQAGIKSDIVKFIYAQRIDEGVWVT